jgi:uncharacterized membrane protein YvbJ
LVKERLPKHKENAIVYCPKCGQANPDEAKFCGKCGAAMTPAPAFSSAGHGATDALAVNPTLKNGVLVGSLFLPIVGIVMGIVYLLDANAEKKATGKLWLIVSVIAGLVWALVWN